MLKVLDENGPERSCVALERMYWQWRGATFYMELTDHATSVDYKDLKLMEGARFVEPPDPKNNLELNLALDMKLPKKFLSLKSKVWYYFLHLLGFRLPSSVTIKGIFCTITGAICVEVPGLTKGPLKALGYDMTASRKPPTEDGKCPLKN